MGKRMLATFVFALFGGACGPPKAVDADEILRHIEAHAGKVVVMRAKFRSGARCRQVQDGLGSPSARGGRALPDQGPARPDEKGKAERKEGKEPKWQTYCKDCQYCRGPIVVDTGKIDPEKENLDDWPMILGGTYKGQDIRCKGPLNQIECYPFVQGKTYIVQGQIEHQRPPKLLVERFWEVE